MRKAVLIIVQDDPNTVTIEAGQIRQAIWRSDGNPPLMLACNIPGHAEAGMVATAMLKP